MHFAPGGVTDLLSVQQSGLNTDNTKNYLAYCGYLFFILGSIGLLVSRGKKWILIRRLLRLYSLFFSLIPAGVLLLKFMVINDLGWLVVVPPSVIFMFLAAFCDFFIMRVQRGID